MTDKQRLIVVVHIHVHSHVAESYFSSLLHIINSFFYTVSSIHIDVFSLFLVKRNSAVGKKAIFNSSKL